VLYDGLRHVRQTQQFEIATRARRSAIIETVFIVLACVCVCTDLLSQDKSS